MKSICRLLFLVFFIGPVVAIIAPKYESPHLNAFVLIDWVILFFGVIFVAASIFIPIFCFKHWGMTEFETEKIKRRWFNVLLGGLFFYYIGPLIYYIVVVERKKTVKREG